MRCSIAVAATVASSASSSARRETPHEQPGGAPGRVPRRMARGARSDRLEVLEHGGPLGVGQMIAECMPTVAVGEDRGVVNVHPLARRGLVVAMVDLDPAPAELLLIVIGAAVAGPPPVAGPPA